jgi:hypothetical protein
MSKLDAKTKVVWVLQAKDEAQVSYVFPSCSEFSVELADLYSWMYHPHRAEWTKQARGAEVERRLGSWCKLALNMLILCTFRGNGVQ